MARRARSPSRGQPVAGPSSGADDGVGGVSPAAANEESRQDAFAVQDGMAPVEIAILFTSSIVTGK
jgi:hypothetical protein